jgi:hypothetical protein
MRVHLALSRLLALRCPRAFHPELADCDLASVALKSDTAARDVEASGG